jgi:hypothetical protein
MASLGALAAAPQPRRAARAARAPPARPRAAPRCCSAPEHAAAAAAAAAAASSPAAPPPPLPRPARRALILSAAAAAAPLGAAAGAARARVWREVDSFELRETRVGSFARSEAEWKAALSADAYRVLRRAVTEKQFSRRARARRERGWQAMRAVPLQTTDARAACSPRAAAR